jgi:hypothetical protein
MDGKDEKVEQISFKDLSQNYLVETGEEIAKNEIKSYDIIEDEDGNCII